MKNYLIKLTVLSVLMGVAALLSMTTPRPEEKRLGFHTTEQLDSFRKHLASPIEPGEYFLTPYRCQGCHGHDPQGIAMVTESGKDVNLFDDWETSMMGLSAYDPLWRAKVSQEILTNPAHSNELQTLCTRCHAPMGHYSAMFKGHEFYTLAEVVHDSLGLGGVGCGGCHAIGPNGLGSTFTGIIPFDTNRVEYGPFENPMAGPMQLYVGLTPTYSQHVSSGEFCSPCHTLISHTVDLEGNPTGGVFVEQATFHEWKNSVYPSQNKTCQKCHMPQVEDPMRIAVGYLAITPRTPFNLHSFAGANRYMVELIKQNKNSLSISAPDANFDSTLAAIDRMLLGQTLQLSTHLDSMANDTVYVKVKLENKAGHKFPSGYPSRRAVLQVTLIGETGDTLFISGQSDAVGNVVGVDSPFEPHYDLITSADQVQVYEMIMGDVNGNRTTVLERAAIHLKDNRLVPQGFTTTHASYDTVQIVGGAATDANFNHINGIEGSGTDEIYYHLALHGYSGEVKVVAKMLYQTVMPSWFDEMFMLSSAEIDSWKEMYLNSDRSLITVDKDSLTILPVSWYSKGKNQPKVWPMPATDGRFNIETGTRLVEIKVYDLEGNMVRWIKNPANTKRLELYLPGRKGCYILKIQTVTGEYTQRILSI
ncbi:MAG: T9SS type A sorting domain-containing protein [Bacteroidia bacterium]|nr:T9SS type A sorting domain-containing protein [Bacteroidia bacterium]